ncbi:hypothetical protein [Vacuolonema iberomarrocanum]|nr:hypothetical protein [filamentous cyanobacterium LEGE 07170]
MLTLRWPFFGREAGVVLRMGRSQHWHFPQIDRERLGRQRKATYSLTSA